MTASPDATFQKVFQLGKAAFERGDYRTSIERLEAARDILGPGSRQGGEAGVWLASAYQAAGRTAEAIALCKRLEQHPFEATRRQSQRLRYILEAPVLRRPEEWTVKIPDLANLPASDPKDRRGSQAYVPNDARSPETPLDPDRALTASNRFAWVALAAAVLFLGGLIIFG